MKNLFSRASSHWVKYSEYDSRLSLCRLAPAFCVPPLFAVFYGEKAVSSRYE
jgi:hypothetical protein